MTTYGAWVLVIALWQGSGAPAVDASPTPSRAACLRLASSFEQAEDVMNAQVPPTMIDQYATHCEYAVGGERDQI